MGVVLLVLVILVGAAFFLRLYQSELIRRTEAELISQGAFVRSMYRERLVELLEQGCGGVEDPSEYGTPVTVDWPVEIEDRFRPIPPRLDLASDPVH
ncbi:MAG: two-component sensor histidine kinase, partial [Bradymonadaceae bacterium]